MKADQIGTRASVYPAGTGPGLIRAKNRVESWLITALMIGLGVAMGAGIDVGVRAWREGGRAGRDDGWSVGAMAETVRGARPVGACVALGLACAGAVWSWTRGARAILRMAHGREVSVVEDPCLHGMVEEMCRAAGIGKVGVWELPDSALNSLSVGSTQRGAVIGVTRGARERLAPDELRAMVAHEVAHVRHLDCRFGQIMATMVGLPLFVCDAAWRWALPAGRAAKRSSDAAKGPGLIGVALMGLSGGLMGVSVALGMFLQGVISRRREILADLGAVELTGDPGAYARVLKRLASDPDPLVDAANRATAHLYIVNPLRTMRSARQCWDSPWASHPPVRSRVSAVRGATRAWASRLASGGRGADTCGS